MNILPKKRWHVRTKENIARVRKDEAEAAEKEKIEQQRIDNADREARLNVLKLKSKQKLLESGAVEAVQIQENSVGRSPEHNAHINFFTDLEHAVQTTNKDHDKEVKEKKEEYEKKIGYLTYLGQDTNEALKKKNWYETLPENFRFTRSTEIKETYDKLVLKDADGKPKLQDLDIKNGEVSWKSKQRIDPLNSFREYSSTSKIAKNELKKNKSRDEHRHTSKLKKDKRNKEYKQDKKYKLEKQKIKKQNLEKLRQERLKREINEKYKTEKFLAGLHGNNSTHEETRVSPKVKPKYNSQFNPQLARQNYSLH